MIVLSPNAIPSMPNSPAVAKPMTISGMMTGSRSSPSAERLNLIRYRVRAIAAAAPMIVANSVVKNPTIRLTRSEAMSSASRHASAYHRQVKPCQIVLKRELLNDKITSTIIGA